MLQQERGWDRIEKKGQREVGLAFPTGGTTVTILYLPQRKLDKFAPVVRMKHVCRYLLEAC